MQFAVKVFERFGLFTRKDQAPDAFDLRLARIGSREARVVDRRVLFRPELQPLEA